MWIIVLLVLAHVDKNNAWQVPDVSSPPCIIVENLDFLPEFDCFVNASMFKVTENNVNRINLKSMIIPAGVDVRFYGEGTDMEIFLEGVFVSTHGSVFKAYDSAVYVSASSMYVNGSIEVSWQTGCTLASCRPPDGVSCKLEAAEEVYFHESSYLLTRTLYVGTQRIVAQSGSVLTTSAQGYGDDGPGSSSCTRGGAGHGGNGGFGGYGVGCPDNDCAGGYAYGNELFPRDWGSGSSGRTGGGAVELSASQYIVLNGSIFCDGSAGGCSSNGASAGGSILLLANAGISGIGSIVARGGSGPSSVPGYYNCGGAGGGGRVSLQSPNTLFSRDSINVAKGGGCITTQGDGTIRFGVNVTACEVGAPDTDDCDHCPETGGYFVQLNPDTEFLECVKCPPGRIAPFEGYNTDNCTDCPVGEASNTVGNLCYACPSGYVVENGDNCAACPQGTYGINGTECKQCPDGTSQLILAADSPLDCLYCLHGTYSTNASEACVDCLPGTYSDVIGATMCHLCSNGTYNPDHKGSVDLQCRDCPLGATSPEGSISSNNCTCTSHAIILSTSSYNLTAEITGDEEDITCVCEPGYGYDASSKVCQTCVPAGYRTDYSLEACLPCPNDAFSQHTDGVSCVCGDGFWLFEGRCEMCPDHATCVSGVISVANGYFLPDGSREVYECFPLISCVSGECSAGYTGLLCGNCDTAYVKGQSGYCTKCADTNYAVLFGLLFPYALVLVLFIHGKTNPKDPNKTILINYCQMVALISLDLAYINESEEVTSVSQNLLKFNFTALIPSLCIMNVSYMGSWFLAILTPVCLTLLLTAVIMSMFYVNRWKHVSFLKRFVEADREQMLARIMQSSMLILVYTYLYVSETIIKVFGCRNVEDSALMVFNLDVVCWEDDHIIYVVFGILAFAVICAGVPSVILLNLHPVLQPHAPHRIRTMNLDILSTMYCPQFAWWEAVIICRKLLLVTIFYVFVSSELVAWKLVFYILIISSSLYMERTCMPFIVRDSNNFSAQTLMVVLVSYALQILVVWSPGSVTSAAISVIIIILNMGYGIYLIPIIRLVVGVQVKKLRKKLPCCFSCCPERNFGTESEAVAKELLPATVSKLMQPDAVQSDDKTLESADINNRGDIKRTDTVKPTNSHEIDVEMKVEGSPSPTRSIDDIGDHRHMRFTSTADRRPAPQSRESELQQSNIAEQTSTTLPDGWTEHQSKSGRSYYYHAETEETTWTRPE